MRKSFLTVILSFLKIGTIGFGGGNALIPVIEQELVEKKKWMDTEAFDIAHAVSSVAPGSKPLALCAVWDSRFAIPSAYFYALPGALIYLILLTGFSFIGHTGVMYIRFASVGLISFVLFLLYRFITKNYVSGAKEGIGKQYLLIMAAAFALTCGNTVNRLALMLFGLELPTPLFAIDIMHLMLLTFFAICFMGSFKSKLRLCLAAPLIVLYSLSVGRRGLLNGWTLPLVIVMLILTAASISYDVVTNMKKPARKPSRLSFKPLKNLLIFILFALTVAVLVFIITGDANTWSFAFKVVSSSLTSFGGGEAYIGISESVFVETGFIPAEIFNTQILGIANSMPGPVLTALSTGVGYTYGNVHYGVAFGWLFGFLGLILAVAATAFGALLLFIGFEILKDSHRLRMVIKYIMPVVCGMLISTALSLLRQASSVIVGEGLSAFASLGIVVVIVASMLLLYKKFRVSDLILLLSGAVLTIVSLGILNGAVA